MIGVEWFAAPAWGWAFLLLPLLVAAERMHAQSRLRCMREAFGARIASERAPQHAASTWTASAFALLVLAVMQPQWGDESQAVPRSGSDLILCVDVSRSMLAGDLEPTRLAAAQADLRALVASGPDDRFALLAFAGEARMLVPLTDDRISFAPLIELAEPSAIRTGGTDLAAAIRRAIEALPLESERTPAIVLLTDGEDLAGEGLRAVEQSERKIPVHAVGYGSAAGSKIVVRVDGREQYLQDSQGKDVITALDPSSLQAIAAAAQGSYRAASADPGMQALRAELQAAARDFDGPAGPERKRSRHAWPLLLAFLLFAWAGRGTRA
jgi:Ca-activated chloride channel family protein